VIQTNRAAQTRSNKKYQHKPSKTGQQGEILQSILENRNQKPEPTRPNKRATQQNNPGKDQIPEGEPRVTGTYWYQCTKVPRTKIPSNNSSTIKPINQRVINNTVTKSKPNPRLRPHFRNSHPASNITHREGSWYQHRLYQK
jgi:hypothetical protein